MGSSPFSTATDATSVVPLKEDPHALHPVLEAEVASIRTDLDSFSDLEVNTLVGHGYEVARSVHRRMLVVGQSPVHEGPVWLPLPGDQALRGTQTADFLIIQMRDRLTLRVPEGASDPSITLRTARSWPATSSPAVSPQPRAGCL